MSQTCINHTFPSFSPIITMYSYIDIPSTYIPVFRIGFGARLYNSKRYKLKYQCSEGYKKANNTFIFANVDIFWYHIKEVVFSLGEQIK